MVRIFLVKYIERTAEMHREGLINNKAIQILLPFYKRVMKKIFPILTYIS